MNLNEDDDDYPEGEAEDDDFSKFLVNQYFWIALKTKSPVPVLIARKNQMG